MYSANADRDAVERSVEDTLRRICHGVLNTDRFDLTRSFFDLGGDSLSVIHFVAGILRAFDVGLTTEAVLAASSIGAVRNLIVDGLAGRGAPSTPALAALERTLQPRQGLVVGPVPLIANRYSYFFRRRRDLHHWNVTSGVLEAREQIDPEALACAVRHLVAHHDALRLRVFEDETGWNQVIVAPDAVDPYITVRYGGEPQGTDLERFVEATARGLQEGFCFPGDLFKVLLIQVERARALLLVLAHHLLVDAYSYRLVERDLFDLYRQYRRGERASLPPKTTSFLDYSGASTDYWVLREDEDVRYWRSLAWENVRRVPVDHGLRDASNIERHTIFVVESVPVEDERRFLHLDAEGHGYTFMVVLLCAIARAYRAWTGHPVLHLATVFHGRESFLPSVDLTRTAGWISETVPVLLDSTMSIDDLLEHARRQVERASLGGKSYGVLRYLTRNDSIRSELGAHPAPEISLNVILPSLRGASSSDVATPARQYRCGAVNEDTTERVFLLSGGAYFRDRRFHISWDFSAEVFERSTIARFTERCMTELLTLTRGVGPAARARDGGT